ncbi:hypothetical protein PIB30_036480 [Stylosanthes scabra]|uniref:Uncharacterized protein n=1 Tax=Stylosanthes scabra TaxID=79078 RepID=A0ABU6XDS0_9FABA|nr:hypothetical protein [Stylosanthes scabra]
MSLNGFLAEEILYPDKRIHGDRDAFWSLRPGQDVYQDVSAAHISAYASFVRSLEAALNPLNYCTETLQFIKSWFMGYADEIKKAYKVHIMLKDPDFNHKDSSTPPAITDYHFREPHVTQQRDNLRDCRVDESKVDGHTRMRIAIDLVLSNANSVREEIMGRAKAHWDKCECAASKQPSKPTSEARHKKGSKNTMNGARCQTLKWVLQPAQVLAVEVKA